jgi:hypothetical protein
MTKPRIGLLALMLVLLMGGVAMAGTWSEKVNFRPSNKTSLKITEPEGFKVTAKLADGEEKVGTVPELFALPDGDAFVTVTITPTDGSAPWTKKIEVRSRQQTELTVSFKGDAPKAEPAKAPGRSFVGRMLNQAGGCGKAWDRSIKVDFLRGADGANAKTVQIDSKKNVDIEVGAGKYDVRVFIWNGTEWKFVLTSNHEITKDGWTLGFGCLRGKNTPTVIDNP